MANIKVKDLTDTQTINTDDEIMILTDENTNLVQNITVENFITNVISSDSDNVIEQGADGKLFVETPVNITGNLSNLTTTNKSTLVGAINEVDGDVGNLSNLTTSVKTNVVNAINSEVSARNTAETNMQNDYNGKIGTLSNLDTTDKSNIVGAINELAAIAEPSLQYETMNNSKALETGAPSENAIILADVQKYAHSTFDRSKFTVVGSPIITDDGIASGFSTSNYLTTTLNNNGSLLNFTCRFKIASGLDSDTMQDIVRGTGFAFGYQYYNSARMLRIKWGNNDSSWDSISYTSFNTDTWYRFKGSFDVATGDSKLYLYDDNGTELRNRTNTLTGATVSSSDFTAYIGTDHSSRYLTGAVDLKYLSLKADGVLAFSGNKTGTDTIKPDDYTVVGTPTISADGIASGFSTSNYVYSQPFTLGTKPWKLQCGFKTESTLIGNPRIITSCKGANSNWYSRLGIWFGNSGRFTIGLMVTDGENNIPLTKDISAQPNTYYLVEVEFTGTQYIYTVNGSVVQTFDNINPMVYYQDSLVMQIGAYADGSRSFAGFGGSVDLNAFKIYVNGNLVYQPCLRIPYTESHSGSKIVDVTYRDRVVDAYEQGYPQRFYTLSDTDFTLPMGEIYGDIEYNRANKLDLTTANATQETVSKINGWCIPDYANGVGKVVNTVYQAAKNVYVKIVNNTDGGAAGYIYIGTTNNPTTEIAQWGGNVATANTVYYMIPKGYYYKVSGTGISSITELPFMGE